jgi:hypothetical protein
MVEQQEGSMCHDGQPSESHVKQQDLGIRFDAYAAESQDGKVEQQVSDACFNLHALRFRILSGCVACEFAYWFVGMFHVCMHICVVCVQ